MEKVNLNEGDVDVQFMHPHGQCKTFNWPSSADKCSVPIKNIICSIQVPTTNTSGRSFTISSISRNDYDKTIAAYAALDS